MEAKCASDVMSLVFWRGRGKHASDLWSTFCNRVMKPRLSHTQEPGWLHSLSLEEEVAMFAPKEIINGLGKKKKFFGVGKKKKKKKIGHLELISSYRK